MDKDANALRTAFGSPPAGDALSAGQQRLLGALQDDVAARRHLICVIAPAGSGKSTLLRCLRKSLRQGLVSLIEQPTPGRLLIDLAKSIQLDASGSNESLLRRRIVMLLAMIDQQKQPIVQIVNAADRLTQDDLNLLLHFFPPAHATLVLAAETPPDKWLSGCTSAAGAARVDRCYELEPWTLAETGAYIRGCLQSAAWSEDSVDAATLALIQRESGGRPGAINRLTRDILLQSSVVSDTANAAPDAVRDAAPDEAPNEVPDVAPDSTADLTSAAQTVAQSTSEGPGAMPPETEVAASQTTSDDEDAGANVDSTSAADASMSSTIETTSVPNAVVEASAKDPKTAERVKAAVSAPIPSRERRRRVTTLRPIVPAHDTDNDENRLARRTRRLRRSVRIWRVVAMLAAFMATALLIQDGWRYFMRPDRATLSGVSEADKEFLPDAADSAGAASSTGTRAPSAGALAPAQNAPGIPPEMLQSADKDTDFAALSTPAQVSDAAPARERGPASATADPVARPPAAQSATESSRRVRERPAQSAPTSRSDPRDRDTVIRSPKRTVADVARATGPVPTRAQREEAARLYAERAEYEWRNGKLSAAAISIRRGLENDPGNTQLLQMRALLQGMTGER